MQLLTLRSAHRPLADPIVSYLRLVEAEDKYHRLVVPISEIQPAGPWQALLHNQRGVILHHAIRRGTRKVVLCRLRYRLGTVVADADAVAKRPSESTGRFPAHAVNQSLGRGVLSVRLGESGTPGLNHVLCFPGLACGAMSLDDIDARIITVLIRDARASYAVIGDEVGLSAPAVSGGWTGCCASGAIPGFTARVGSRRARLDDRGVRGAVLRRVHLARGDRRGGQAAPRGGLWLQRVPGQADAPCTSRAADIRHFEQVVERIAAEPFVQRTRSVINSSRPGARIGRRVRTAS